MQLEQRSQQSGQAHQRVAHAGPQHHTHRAGPDLPRADALVKRGVVVKEARVVTTRRLGEAEGPLQLAQRHAHQVELHRVDGGGELPGQQALSGSGRHGAHGRGLGPQAPDGVHGDGAGLAGLAQHDRAAVGRVVADLRPVELEHAPGQLARGDGARRAAGGIGADGAAVDEREQHGELVRRGPPTLVEQSEQQLGEGEPVGRRCTGRLDHPGMVAHDDSSRREVSGQVLACPSSTAGAAGCLPAAGPWRRRTAAFVESSVILTRGSTAVSVPDDLYARAELLAQRLGRSRSALYAEALQAYLEQVEDQPDEVTAALDRLYATDPATRAAGAVTARRLIDAGDWEW